MIQRFHSAVARKKAATPPIGGGGLSNFNDLSGCIMQCLASQLSGYSIGDYVPAIPDSSTGGGLHMDTVSGTPTYQIVSGKPVVRFAPLDVLANLRVGSTPSPCTVIARARISGASRGRIITTGSGGNNWLIGWWNNARDQMYCDMPVKLDGVPAADTTWQTYVGTFASALCDFYSSAAGLLASGAGNPPSTIGVNSQAGEQSDCEFAGLVVYNSVLSTPDLAAAMALMDTL